MRLGSLQITHPGQPLALSCRAASATAFPVLAWLFVAACNNEPTAPQQDPGVPRVAPELIIIDDTTSMFGDLIDSATLVITADSTYQQDLDTLWWENELNDSVLIQITSNIEHDGRVMSARELLVRGDTVGAIPYYHSNGDLYYRQISMRFSGEPDFIGGWQDVIVSQTDTSVVMRDTDAALHGRIVWIDADASFYQDWNANNPPPPSCGANIGNICFPLPPFDAANTSNTRPHGTVHVRVYEINRVSLVLSAPTTELHPWIRYFQPNATPPPFIQAGSVGDAANITLTVSLGASLIASQQVDVRAEILPSGGHAHLTAAMDLGDAHLADLPGTSLLGDGKPVAGMFAHTGDTTTSVSDVTNASGQVSFAFVAGFMSGDVDIIASTVYNGATFEDTLQMTVRVPSLVPLHADNEIFTNALFIGPTAYHPDSWYATSQFAAAVEAMVIGERRTVGAQTYYLQLNDASLPLGGAFTVEPPQTTQGVRIEQPGLGHRSHALGVEEDLSWCYALTNEFAEAGDRISGTNCSTQGTLPVDPSRLEAYGFVVLIEQGSEPHYHLRGEAQ